MRSRRRKQLLAATAAGLLLAVILVGVLANATGSSNTISVPAAQIPSTPTDPHAKDRAQITALALGFQKALAQDPNANPCSYLDPQSRVATTNKAKTAYAGGPEPCWFAAQNLSSDAGLLYPPGIDENTIQFGQPAQQVRCVAYSPPTSLPPSQRGLSWAIAGWTGANGQQITFVKENNRWWIDLLLCHA